MESRFFKLPREMQIGSKNQEFEKSKVASNHTCSVYCGIVLQDPRRKTVYNGMTLLFICKPSLFTVQTKRTFKTKRTLNLRRILEGENRTLYKDNILLFKG